jgi:hypothetical protein
MAGDWAEWLGHGAGTGNALVQVVSGFFKILILRMNLVSPAEIEPATR